MTIAVARDAALECVTRFPVVLSLIGPAVPTGVPAEAVRLSAHRLSVESARWMVSPDQLAVAFRLPDDDAAEPAIVAIAAVAEASTAVGEVWRTELSFEQVSRGDAERIASFVVRRQFDGGR